jgi:hypothetical protein
MIAIKNTLVATDFSEPADAALRSGRSGQPGRRFFACFQAVRLIGPRLKSPVG